MKATLQELRYAVRGLRRAPGFSLLAVVTLALGVGATTAIYSLVRGILLEPPPYPNAAQLVWLGHQAAGQSQDQLLMTPALYTHYAGATRTLGQIAIFRNRSTRILSGDEIPQTVPFTETTQELASILGAKPALGRWISAADLAAERPVVVLAHSLWASRYGSDPAVLGRTIQLEDVPYEVIGVMEDGFSFPGRNALWVPYPVHGTEPFRATDGFGAFCFFGIGRLRAGFSPEDARAELTSLLPRVRDAFPGEFSRFVIDVAQLTPTVEPLRTWGVAALERTLWLLFGAVVFILLIACVNVANLLLVRAETQRRFVAVRLALGARRGDLLRLYFGEAALLAGAGGALGCIGAVLLLGIIRRVVPEHYLTWELLARGPHGGLSANVLLFTLLVCVATTVVFAAIPALRPVHISRELKEGAGTSGLAPSRGRIANVLVASEVALTMALLVGGGLMLRSLRNLQNADLGFVTEGRLMFQLSSRLNRGAAAALHQSVLDALADLPGVEAAGAVRCLPLTETCHVRTALFAEDVATGESQPPTDAVSNVATEGYFEALGIPLLAGRTIERSDHEQRTGAVVISASTARQLWPGGDPIGKRLRTGTGDEQGDWLDVVGVVGDVQLHHLTDDAATARTIYTPMLGRGRGGRHPRSMLYVVRTAGEPLALVPAIRQVINTLNADASIGQLETMNGWVAGSVTPTRSVATLLGLGALLALVLSSVGVYGVASYAVAQRTREFGIRRVLGARGSDIWRLMLRRSAVPALSGVAVGLALAMTLSGVLRSFLVGVGRVDAVTVALTVALLLFAVFMAINVPARRATTVDPLESLSAE